MEPSTEKSGATLVAEGDIVASNAEGFRKDLLEQVRQGVTTLIVDLEKVTLIDSTGLGVLIAAKNHLEPVGGVLRLINVNGEISKMLRLMRLDKHFDVVPAS